jgi:hypothetical protein
LLDVLSNGIYNKYGVGARTTMPAFSIEHLGNGKDTLNFNECINSANECTWAAQTDLNAPNWPVLVNGSKYVDRCGVANFFGNWSEDCFVSFLDKFVNKWGYSKVMVYDAGFIPKRWLDDLDINNNNVTAPSLTCGPVTVPPQCGTSVPTNITDLNACLQSLGDVGTPAPADFIVYNTTDCPVPNTPVSQ